MKTYLVFALAMSIIAPNFFHPGNVNLKLDNIRSNKGVVLVSVYENEDQYPMEPFKVYKFDKKKLKDGSMTCVLKGLKKGRYGMSILDDENENSDMDYSWIGTPQEGYGFANNAKPNTFSAPDFRKVQFDVINSDKKMAVSMQYW